MFRQRGETNTTVGSPLFIIIRLKPSLGFQPFLLPLFLPQNFDNMNKGTHFIGQPMYGQLLNLLDKAKILRFSREMGGERYVKHFDAWQHLVIMLYEGDTTKLI